MNRLALSTAALLAVSDAAKQYVATFGADNGTIIGNVVVDNGALNIDLTFGGDEALPDGFATCVAGGLGYHIHELWTHTDSEDKIGATDCGGDFTGGHWDPWNACGGASGNAYCDKVGDGTTTAGECIPTSLYGTTTFAADPFAAEVGDWSSKYGTVMVTDNAATLSVSNFYEVLPAEVAGFSVVFHCNGGTRAFCAPFAAGTDDSSATVPYQDYGNTPILTATFDIFSAGDSSLVLHPDGSIEANLDATNNAVDVTDANCAGGFAIGIFEAGQVAFSDNSYAAADCAVVLGDAYDPTHQCVPFSGSSYCTDGKLCAVDTYSYDCQFATARYSCAPGDLTGRLGGLIANLDTVAYSQSYTGRDSLIAPTATMADKFVAIYCPAAATPTFVACAKFTATTLSPTTAAPTTAPPTTPSPTTEGEGDLGNMYSNVVAVFAGIIALLY